MSKIYQLSEYEKYPCCETHYQVTTGNFMSTTEAVSIFVTAGGSLAMYKMKHRTDSLTEFRIQEEGVVGKKIGEAKLHGTICISGWLHDKHDFQRPWGCSSLESTLVGETRVIKTFLRDS